MALVETLVEARDIAEIDKDLVGGNRDGVALLELPLSLFFYFPIALREAAPHLSLFLLISAAFLRVFVLGINE